MLDALTLDQLRAFVAVAEAGSFRAGAGRIARVQSAVSHAIGNLEATLGVTLFDRSGHRPGLTQEGKALLADARAILLKVDSLRARARGLGEGVELGLSIIVDTLFPLPVVAAALRDLRGSYSTVAVRMEVAPMGAPFAALHEGRCTFGITVGSDFREPRIQLEALTALPFVAVVAPTHPLAGMTSLTMADLVEHVQVVLEDPTPLSEGRDFGVLSPDTWRVTTQDAKHGLILGGLGWGRLPLWLVARDLAEGRLVRLPVSALGRDGEVMVEAYLAHRTDQPLGPAAMALRQALLRHANQTGD